MSERGQRTKLTFGGVSAEVSLLKTSGKPKAAQHETKRVETPPAAHVQQVTTREQAQAVYDSAVQSGALTPGLRAAALDSGHPVDPDEGVVTELHPTEGGGADPLGENGAADLDTPTVLGGAIDPALPPEPAPAAPASAPTPAAYVPPPTDVQQGVHLEDGTWVDLTARLAEADERTRLEGLEVVATIAQSAVPRERVREAHYVAGVEPETFKVLALLWHALRQTDRAAAVRWSKRTAQALGIVVARGRLGHDAHLVLLELEWAENMRAPSPRVLGPIKAAVEAGEVASAVELVEAFEAGPSALNGLRDERLAKRAELLTLAKAGRLEDYTPPPERMPEADDVPDLAAALAASTAWVREHATA